MLRRAGIVAASVLSFIALGCHVENFHLGSIHSSGGDYEEFCTDVNQDSNPSVTDASLNAAVDEALWLNGHSNDWEAVNGAVFVNRGDCDDYTTFELEDIEIQFYVSDDVPACGGFPGCA